MAGLFGLGRGKESGQAGSQAKTETTSSLLIKDTTTASFSADVITELARQPVLVDFWAPWCEPCKQLAPILEKTVKAAGGKVKLVKMNIDEHPEIPGRLGVRSIPAVIAFQRGQPVDGFMGALPEREVKGFIERLAGPIEEMPIAWAKPKPWPLQAMVKARRSSMPRFSPKNPATPPPWPDWQNSLLLRARSKALRRFWPRLPQAASATLRSLPPRPRSTSLNKPPPSGIPQSLSKVFAANPEDHQARFDFAILLNAQNRREEAAAELLAIIKRDRASNDDGARKQLLQFFDAWGPIGSRPVSARKALHAAFFLNACRLKVWKTGVRLRVCAARAKPMVRTTESNPMTKGRGI